MKVTFKCEELERVLRDVVRVVPTSTTRQVLKHVLISASSEDDRVDVCASSEDMSVRRTLFQELVNPPVTIEESGSCLLPAREVHEIVKKASGLISLETKGTKTEIVFGKAKYELAGLEPRLFTPYVNDGDDTTTARILAPELHRLLRRTTYATAKGNARPILTGVHLALSDTSLLATGTDAMQLSQYTAPCQSVVGEPRSLTVSAGLLEKLAAVLPAHDDDEEVSLAIGSASCVVSWGDDMYRMVMRGLEGSYPDTSRIIPQNTPYKMVAERQALLAACERVSILSETDHQRTKVHITPERIVLSAHSNQYGNATDTVDVQSSTITAEMNILCNINYWIALLRSYDGVEQVEISLMDANKPMLFRPVNGAGLGLIAPVLIQAQERPTERAAS
ncbi:MAG: DNA polymerase III subunit beta [Alicyclobacillus sp.]|nr:DNA polymerase III subunit beta [Alicyclobacillus sp.]